MSINFVKKSNLNFKYLKILWFIVDDIWENIANVLLVNCDLREKYVWCFYVYSVILIL